MGVLAGHKGIMIRELDTVVLLKDHPYRGLVKGEMGPW